MKEAILITGAGSGLGEGAALGLAKAGYEVIATTQTEEQAEALRVNTSDLGLTLVVEKLDLLDSGDVAAALEIDFSILVNNAGIGEGGPISEIPVDLVRHNFEVNVFSPLALTQQVARKWVDTGTKGKIVVVSSLLGLISPPVIASYAATKHALEEIARSLYIELKPFGIQVQMILPGPYLTGFNEGMVEKAFLWMDDTKNFTKGDVLRAQAKVLIGNPEARLDPNDMVAKMVEIIPQREAESSGTSGLKAYAP